MDRPVTSGAKGDQQRWHVDLRAAESARDDFAAAPGGKLEMTASIEQPDPASGLGYWPAFWSLGSPMRTGGGWPQSCEIEMMEDVNALNEAS